MSTCKNCLKILVCKYNDGHNLFCKEDYKCPHFLDISTLEKQIPKKPKILTYQLLIDAGWEYACPNCGCAVGKNDNLGFAYAEYLEPYEDYCCCCGQALDWRV